MATKTKHGPRTLVYRGTTLVREWLSPPMLIRDEHWEEYHPVSDDDFRIFERSIETGRIIQTMGN